MDYGLQRIGYFRVNVREALKISLRVTRWNPAQAIRAITGAAAAAGNKLCGLREAGVPELIRIFLFPFDSTLRAVDAQAPVDFCR